MSEGLCIDVEFGNRRSGHEIDINSGICIVAIKVNGSYVDITDRVANITVPTKLSDLRDDIHPVKSVNGRTPDTNGNVEIETGIGDAPSDGKQYARKNGEWAEVEASGGASTYADLPDKPSINGTTLSGNKTAAQLGLQPTVSDIDTIRSNAASGKAASDALGGHTVGKDVPSDAKFTDTIYDDTAIKGRVSTIEGKIPSQASASNQLADKDFVNSSIQNVAAYYITKDAAGNPFATKAELLAATTFYSGGQVRVPTRNDYLVVLADESKTIAETGENPTTRYIYDNGVWSYQYIVNRSGLTAAQWAAVSSGITAALVSKLGALPDAEDLTALLAGKVDKVSGKGLSTNDYDDTEKAKVANALQPSDLTPYRTSSEQDIIDNGKQPKLTAGANITIENNVISATGSGGNNVFVATYNVTPFADMKSASESGKVVLCKYGNDTYILTIVTASKITFASANNSGIKIIEVLSANIWIATEFLYEKTINRVSVITASSTNSQYPSAKAVKDYVDAYGGSGPWENGEGTYSAQIPNGGADATGDYSVAEGHGTAQGNLSHAEGCGTVNSGINYRGFAAHAEGGGWHEGDEDYILGGTASGMGSHAEGLGSTASGVGSHSEGGYYEQGEYEPGGTASGPGSHAEGSSTAASGGCSHAEGFGSVASGSSSHAEGAFTAAGGHYSHAEGESTLTQNHSEHASGKRNSSSKASTTFGNAGNTHFSIGIGTDGARANAVEVMQNGDVYIKGIGNYTGAYASSGIKSLQTVIGEKEFFTCEYGATTLAEIVAAKTAGKIPILSYQDRSYINTIVSDNTAYFIAVTPSNWIYMCFVDSTGWYAQAFQGEMTINKVTSLSSSSTDMQYPSAKCVYDLIGNVESLLNALL